MEFEESAVLLLPNQKSALVGVKSLKKFGFRDVPAARVSKFAVENVFNSNATIVVLNSTKTTAINDNEKNLAKNEEKLTSS